MKKYLKYSLFLIAFVSFHACSNDDSKQEIVTEEPVKDPTIAIKLASEFAVQNYNVTEITPEVTIENANGKTALYQWSVKVSGKDGVAKDSVIGDSKTLLFITPKANNYVVDLKVTVDKIVKEASTKVTVSETGKTYTAKALKLIDFLPAPSYNIGSYTTKEESLQETQVSLNEGGAAYLGTFGGYIVTAFDHTVVNAYGKRDLNVLMATGTATTKYAPVSIAVAYDANKNGIADENEWYEIAGSEYYKSTTVKNYEITYHKPNASASPIAGAATWQYDTAYLPWTDNKNGSGTITKTNTRRRNNYYPAWVGDTYTLKGTKVFIPTKDVSDGAGTSFNVGTFEWGYGGIKDPSIDISWAVDKDGKKVHLPGVDFVKVYVSSFAALGANDLLTSVFQEVSDLNFPKQ
ncbi:hypothetical protein IRZ71_05465 [Flavobacterium sp. ANB]|uniref:hypothetical protein n=1 Tax=unclassified Flavobacterium TaxID=196869 RepID=UPI0012B9AA85|nr:MULTISPECIES: hypothetical protein [unclassified Flavobacterium]MBF4515778.1 hypothetical protein [Flavobacterium sp. ANB]MTD68781.1 hypothetical protein [Flavobacterium sp. LC2016-13]